MTTPIIVADASPLIALTKLDRLALLPQLFSELHLPQMVYHETTLNQSRPDARLLKSFLDEHAVLHADTDNEFILEVKKILDSGESQALALAKALNCGVLIDELRGRKVAGHYGLPVVGILGVLMQSKKQGLIGEVAPLIQQLQDVNYRLSDGLIQTVLERMKEA